MRITRRELAASLAAGAAAFGQEADTPESLVRAAAGDLNSGVSELRKVPLPMETEPAFEFRAQ